MIGTKFFNGTKIDSAHLKGYKARIELGLGAGESQSQDPQFFYFFIFFWLSHKHKQLVKGEFSKFLTIILTQLKWAQIPW